MHTGNIILPPIDPRGDVSPVLGMDTGDVVKLHRSVSVNKWAKYKPIALATINTLGQLDSNLRWRSDATWWKDSDGLCGMTIPSYANIGELIGTSDVWVRKAMTANDPARIQDFCQYNGDAEQPYTLTLPPSVISTTSATAGGRMVVRTASQLPDYNLLLSDLGGLVNMYFGLVVVKGQQAYIKTNSVTLANGGGSVIVLQGCPLVSSAGQVRVYAVLCSHVASDWTNNYEYQILSLNSDTGVAIADVSVVVPASNTYKITLSGLTQADLNCWSRRGVITCSLSGGRISGSDEQLNNMSSGYTLNTVTWAAVRHSDQTTISTGSVSPVYGNAQPDYLEARIDTPGASTTFWASYNVGSLPALDDPTDYYEINYTFNYA